MRYNLFGNRAWSSNRARNDCTGTCRGTGCRFGHCFGAMERSVVYHDRLCGLLAPL